MGVYVRGMEHPMFCVNCPLTYFHLESKKVGARCYITDKFITEIDINKDCPMMEVKTPHGRLVDADFEEQHYASMTINPTPDVTKQDHIHSGYTARAFQMAKTVIEAEGE